jgi:hypothetical protein
MIQRYREAQVHIFAQDNTCAVQLRIPAGAIEPRKLKQVIDRSSYDNVLFGREQDSGGADILGPAFGFQAGGGMNDFAAQTQLEAPFFPSIDHSADTNLEIKREIVNTIRDAGSAAISL